MQNCLQGLLIGQSDMFEMRTNCFVIDRTLTFCVFASLPLDQCIWGAFILILAPSSQGGR